MAWVVLVAGCTTGGQPPISATTTTLSPATSTTSAPEQTSTTFEATGTTVPFESPGDLLVLGDWGSGTAAQAAVAGVMALYEQEHEVAAVVTTGDNFYSDNAVALLEPMQWVFERGIPIWVVWGNHDVETASRVAAVEEAFGSPPRWTTHQWGRVDVMILDSNQVGSAEQLAFLVDALAESEEPTIVVFHHPALSCSSHGDTRSVLQTWVPLFDEDVVLVLSGHDHNYQRFEDSGVTYVVSGGGGRSLYPLRSCPADHPERLAGEEVHHFLTLTQDVEAITVGVIGATDEIIDSFEVPLP